MHSQDNATALIALHGWSRAATALAGEDCVDFYLRVSGGKQEDEQTIETQRTILTMGVAQCGGRVGETYEDNPFTGTIRDRPGLNKLIAAAKRGLVRSLLIYDTSRLARGEPWLRPMIEDELKQAGVQIAYVLNETDDSDEGQVLSGLQSLFDNWERKKIARRLKDGRFNKLQRGALWRGKRPYGWLYHTAASVGLRENEPHRKDGELVHHPDEAPIARDIITRIASGEMTAHAMAADLNRRDLRTTEGNAWSPYSVRRVVTNPLNAGLAPRRLYEAVRPKKPRKTMAERQSKHLKSSSKRVPRHDWELLDHQVQGIVTPALQDAAKDALTRKRCRSTRETKEVFALRGLIYCMAPRCDRPDVLCERRMHGEAPADQRPFYRCTYAYEATPERRAGRCKTHIKAPYIDTLVWHHVRDIITHPDLLLTEMHLAQQSEADAAADAQTALLSARRAVETAKTAVDNLTRRYRQGKMAEEDYDVHYAEACLEREHARTWLADAERSAADVGHHTQRWAGLMDFFSALQTRLAEAEQDDEHGAHTRAALIERLVERVDIYPDGRKRLIGRLPSVTRELGEDAHEHVKSGSSIEVSTGFHTLSFAHDLGAAVLTA